jgi:hypothetical protein
VRKRLTAREGKLHFEPSCLLLFVDETGHEHFADAQFPIFGLGGCAVMGSQYDEAIRHPWQEIKIRHLGSVDRPVHARDLRNLPSEAMQAFAEFFQSGAFARFAIVLKNTTLLPEGMEPYQVAAPALMKRIESVAKWQPMTSIAIVFEASARGDRLAARYFSLYDMQEERDGTTIPVPITLLRMAKSTREPGLEVADLIVHAAGAQVNSRLRGKIGNRKDFAAIFEGVHSHLCSFIEINDVRDAK